MRKRFRYSDCQSPKELFGDFESLKTLGKDELFDLFESAHIEGGKHL